MAPPPSSSTSAGAPPIYGNYASYYAKRGTSVLLGDRRVSRLPPAWVQDRRVLDIGCNSGQVAVELGLAGARQVTGVDIDPDLIRKAGTHVAFVNSLRDPTTGAADRFPLALPKEHGFLAPVVRAAEPDEAGADGEGGGFPANVEFVAADWVTEAIPADAAGYDLVLALSLTKWIHLHHADDGLLAFFAKIHRLLLPGGRLVLEPQAWSTYKDAIKKTRGAVPKERLAELALRPEAFGAALERLGFERDGVLRMAGEEEAGDAAQAGFDRPIEVYVKRG